MIVVPFLSVSSYLKSFGPPLYPHATLSHWNANDVFVILVEMTFVGGAEGTLKGKYNIVWFDITDVVWFASDVLGSVGEVLGVNMCWVD